MALLDRNLADEIGEDIRKSRSAAKDAIEMQVGIRAARLRSTSKTPKSVATRERIMNAASQLMTERGNTDFQMSEVSALCNMSKGALYYYFSDKVALTEAIYDRSVAELVDSVEAAVSEAPTARASMEALAHVLARRIKESGPLSLAMGRELLGGRAADEMLPTVETHLARVISIITTQLDRAKGEGVVREGVDSRLAAISICGAFVFSAMELGSSAQADTERLAHDLLDICLNGVAVAPAAEA